MGQAVAQAAANTIAVNGRNVPLPPGTWQKVAESSAARTYDSGVPSNGLNTDIALLRVEGGQVTGLVTISTSRDPSGQFAGWTKEPECSRTDIHAVRVETNTQRDQDCWTLNHITMTRGEGASAFINRYYEAAAAAGGMPPTMLRVTSRRADALHYITVRYYFAPDQRRFPATTEAWRTNPWHRDRLDAARSEYVRAVTAWAQAVHAGVSRGFRGATVSALSEP
jgi:hypothetical protein